MDLGSRNPGEVDGEGGNSPFHGGRANQGDVVSQPGEKALAQQRLLFPDLPESRFECSATVASPPQRGEIVDRGHETRQKLERWGPGLPTRRPHVRRRSDLESRQPRKMGAAPPEDSQMGPEELVCRANEEVAANSLDVEVAVRRQVDRVDVAEGSHPGGARRHPAYIDEGSKGIRATGDRDQSGAIVDKRIEMIEVEGHIGAELGEDNLYPAGASCQPPGGDVGIMVEGR